MRQNEDSSLFRRITNFLRAVSLQLLGLQSSVGAQIVGNFIYFLIDGIKFWGKTTPLTTCMQKNKNLPIFEKITNLPKAVSSKLLGLQSSVNAQIVGNFIYSFIDMSKFWRKTTPSASFRRETGKSAKI